MSSSRPSFAQHYHDRTKYTPAAIAAQNRQVDWDKQPVPFKDYKLGREVSLKPFLGTQGQDWTAEAVTIPGDRTIWTRLSRFLLNSYGITAKITALSGDSVYLRTAPSAGGLYPAEMYLISRGTPELPPGLYHYQPRTHALLHFWDNQVWPDLQPACCWHPALEQSRLAVITTAIYYRSAWRYQARAYRRVCLDTGHLWGNIELAATLTDYRVHLIGGFIDAQVNQLLYLDGEQEGVLAIAALTDLLKVEENLPAFPTALPAASDRTYAASLDGEALLPYMVQATAITEDLTYPSTSQTATGPDASKYDLPFGLKVSTLATPIAWGDRLEGLESTILKRRSTRRYTGLTLASAELLSILDFAYQPAHYQEQHFDGAPDYFDLSLIETFVVVLGVMGLDEGCYYYAVQAQELRQVRFKTLRRDLHHLCLGQDLGRDAGAIVVHTANLDAAIDRYGDRAYRYLHMDAGHVGQRLNLAAIRLGLGVSGIAGFYDDQVNEVLGIPTDAAVLYLTTLGQPR